MRVIGKAEAFRGKHEDIAIQLLVLILVVQNDDSVFACRKVIEARRGVIAFDWEVGLAEGFGYVLRPSHGGGEKSRTEQSLGTAETGDVDDKRAVAFAAAGRCPPRRGAQEQCKEEPRECQQCPAGADRHAAGISYGFG